MVYRAPEEFGMHDYPMKRGCRCAVIFCLLGFLLFPVLVCAEEDATGASDALDTALDSAVETVEGLTQEIEAAGEGESMRLNLPARFAIAAGIIFIQVLLILFLQGVFKTLAEKLKVYGEKRFKQVKIKKYVLMSVAQVISLSQFLLKIAQYAVNLFQLFITLPIVFSLFELTKNLASTLFGYILTPVKSIALGFVNYIPNLFTIAIIIIIARYILRSLQFCARQVERGKLVIHGFYADWARPTFNILRVLIYAFTIAMVFPYLPNSESQIFQGVSVLVGVLLSLGSSSVVSNLIAGIVMTYMRPFKIGDRISIDNVTGYVEERGAMVTRLRTTKNEYIAIPNQKILGTSVMNYTRAASENGPGLIAHLEVTMGYDVPWQTVHEILINAALKTPGVEPDPRPFVLQTKLNDFYCHYEINGYTRAVDKISALYSALYQNVQDGFIERNISLYAPHYAIYQQAKPDGGALLSEPRSATP
jgi:small-conductance mechanosensitive channel